MSLRDEFGILTRNAEMRARYGERVAHGKARANLALPPVVVVPDRPAKALPERKVATLPVVPRVISDDTMRRASNLEILTVRIGASLAESSDMLAEIETMLAEASRVRVVEVRHIIRVVSVLSGISVTELQSDRKARHIARPRQVIMYLAKEHLGLSLPKIGRALGNRDHTTVLHGHRKIRRLLSVDDQLAAFVGRCEAVLEKRGSQPEHSGSNGTLSASCTGRF